MEVSVTSRTFTERLDRVVHVFQLTTGRRGQSRSALDLGRDAHRPDIARPRRPGRGRRSVGAACDDDPGGGVRRRGDLGRSGHDGARRGAGLHPSTRSRRQWLRRAGVLRLGHRHGLPGHLPTERWRVVDHAHDIGPLQDEDPGPPAGGSGPVQRDRGRRMDERDRRRVGRRLGLPQSHADTRRVRLRRGVGPVRCRRRWAVTPRSAFRGWERGGWPRRDGAGTVRIPPPSRRPVRARYLRPDRERSPDPRPTALGGLHPRHIVAVGESQSLQI